MWSFCILHPLLFSIICRCILIISMRPILGEDSKMTSEKTAKWPTVRTNLDNIFLLCTDDTGLHLTGNTMNVFQFNTIQFIVLFCDLDIEIGWLQMIISDGLSTDWVKHFFSIYRLFWCKIYRGRCVFKAEFGRKYSTISRQHVFSSTFIRQESKLYAFSSHGWCKLYINFI